MSPPQTEDEKQDQNKEGEDEENEEEEEIGGLSILYYMTWLCL